MMLAQFTVVLKRVPTANELNWLFARCSDLCVVSRPHHDLARVLVDRHAPSVVDAIISTIRDLDTVGMVSMSLEPYDDLAPDRVDGSAGHGDVHPPTYTAINLALRLRALAPEVDRIAAIRSLISG